jgi:hypothetical protein
MWVGGVAQVVEDLPSKDEALSSNPSVAKKKGKERTLYDMYDLWHFLFMVLMN